MDLSLCNLLNTRCFIALQRVRIISAHSVIAAMLRWCHAVSVLLKNSRDTSRYWWWLLGIMEDKMNLTNSTKLKEWNAKLIPCGIDAITSNCWCLIVQFLITLASQWLIIIISIRFCHWLSVFPKQLLPFTYVLSGHLFLKAYEISMHFQYHHQVHFKVRE